MNTLHSGGIQGNVMQALKGIDFDGDGKFDFLEFSALHEKFPTVLYPAFRLQQQMCANVMGASWWFKKKAHLMNMKEDEIRRNEKLRKARYRELLRNRNQDIRSEMGILNYYNPKFAKKRDYLERMSPAPIVEYDADKQLQVKYPDPVKKPGDEQFVEQEEDEAAANNTNPNKRKASTSGLH